MVRNIVTCFVLASLYLLPWPSQVSGAPKLHLFLPAGPDTIGIALEPHPVRVGDTAQLDVYFTPCEDMESLDVLARVDQPVGIRPDGLQAQAFVKSATKGQIIRISGTGTFCCPGQYSVSVHYTHRSGHGLPSHGWRDFRIRIPGGVLIPPPPQNLPIQVKEAPPGFQPSCLAPCGEGELIHLNAPPPVHEPGDDIRTYRVGSSALPQPKNPTAPDSLLSVRYSVRLGKYSFRISVGENGDFEYLEYEKGWNDAEGAVGERVRSSLVGRVSASEMGRLFAAVIGDCCNSVWSWAIPADSASNVAETGSDYERLEVTIKGKTNSYTSHQPFALDVNGTREELCRIKMAAEKK